VRKEGRLRKVAAIDASKWNEHLNYCVQEGEKR
jgi:hypothetical protein